MAKRKWYVVTRGREVGVFNTWVRVAALTNDCSGAIHQSFATEYEAHEEYRKAMERGDVYIINKDGSREPVRTRPPTGLGRTRSENDATQPAPPQETVTAPPAAQPSSPSTPSSTRRTRALGPSLSAPVIGSPRSAAHVRRTAEIARALLEHLEQIDQMETSTVCPTCHGDGVVRSNAPGTVAHIHSHRSATPEQRSPDRSSASSLTGANDWSHPSQGWSASVPLPSSGSPQVSRTISVGEYGTPAQSPRDRASSRAQGSPSSRHSSSRPITVVPAPVLRTAASVPPSPVHRPASPESMATPRLTPRALPTSPVRLEEQQMVASPHRSSGSSSSSHRSSRRDHTSHSRTMSDAARLVHDVMRQMGDIYIQPGASPRASSTSSSPSLSYASSPRVSDAGSPRLPEAGSPRSSHAPSPPPSRRPTVASPRSSDASHSSLSSLGLSVSGLASPRQSTDMALPRQSAGMAPMHVPSSGYDIPSDPRSPVSRNQRVPYTAR
ncbi:uncharacterized protein SCHCODRAFT_02510537 [Schizophyllum commune H4-8]|nr:uncharacterized protein SCHCODRAFT_02510537 [Schizophyllum commune H4-8]KAI5889419.1 hypothetical protein SCHCODRAFT_02510537 [Schizophyllum commune H4-8]